MQGIYRITHKASGTTYVGSSTDIEDRWRRHKTALRGGKHYNPHLQHAWDKYGAEAFEWGIIEEAQDEGNLLKREQHWLDRFLESPETCYNIATVTEKPPSWMGRTLTEEHKRKISETHLGRVHSEEARHKISVALMGNRNAQGQRCLTEEDRRVWREIRSGWHHTEEARRKISEAGKGRKHTDEAKRKMGEIAAKPYPAFIHRETGAIIPAGINLNAMCERRGIAPQHMYAVKNGKRKSHKGWTLLKEEGQDDET